MNVLKSLGADAVRLVFTDEGKERTAEVVAMYKGKYRLSFRKNLQEDIFQGKTDRKGD